MVTIRECIIRILRSPFLLFDKIIPEYMRNAVQGAHHITKNKTLKKSTWRCFRKACGKKQILLIGSDTGFDDFVKLYGAKYYVGGVYDHFVGRVGEYRQGYRVKNLWDLQQADTEPYCILITSTLYADHIASILERKRIRNYYSYLHMERRRFKYRLCFPFYALRYRVIPQIPNLFKNYIFFDLMCLGRRISRAMGSKRFSKLQSLRGKYTGKRCFIIATGPSLTLEDVESLKDEYTFGVNGLIRLYSQMSYRPTFYAICDYNVCREYIESGVDMATDEFCQTAAFVTDAVGKILSSESRKKTFILPYSYLNHMVSARGLTFRYRKDIAIGGYNAASVVNFCINIAHYMGFSEIYLIGVDCQSTNGKQYFDDYRMEQKMNPYMRIMCERNSFDAYEFIKNKVERDGTHVFNATRGGALNVFRRVDLETVLMES